MDRHKYRVYYEFEIDGKLHKGVESEAGWFLMTQSSEMLQHGLLQPIMGVREYKKIIPLFCTGLKDKHGKLIFDGDILMSKSDVRRLFTNDIVEKNRVELYEVRWEPDEGRWGRINSKGDFELLSGLRQKFMTKWYEIIGNRFENPELLEAKP